VSESKKDQLRYWVKLMLDPHLFSRGIRLEQFQQALSRLQMMKRSEVIFLLDTFEEGWTRHNAFKAVCLKKYASMAIDVRIQANIEDLPKELTDLNELQDQVGKDLQLHAGGRDTDKDAEMKKAVREARAAYRWARLVASRGQALLKFDPITMVRECKRLQRKKYGKSDRQVAAEAGELHVKKQALAKLSPELSKLLHTVDPLQTVTEEASPETLSALPTEVLQMETKPAPSSLSSQVEHSESEAAAISGLAAPAASAPTMPPPDPFVDAAQPAVSSSQTDDSAVVAESASQALHASALHVLVAPKSQLDAEHVDITEQERELRALNEAIGEGDKQQQQYSKALDRPSDDTVTGV